MIDESLRHHYTRLFNVKPTIDTSKPRHFMPKKRVRTRPSSAQVLRINKLHDNGHCSSDTEGVRQSNIFCVNSSDNENHGVLALQDKEVMYNEHQLTNGYENMVTNQQTAVASRIDQFLSEVSERERELEEERQQRMESRKRPDWNRSISYQSSFKSQLSSRKLSSSQSPSLSRDLSNRSSQVSRDKKPVWCPWAYT